jgi:hypothetical protein
MVKNLAFHLNRQIGLAPIALRSLFGSRIKFSGVNVTRFIICLGTVTSSARSWEGPLRHLVSILQYFFSQSGIALYKNQKR